MKKKAKHRFFNSKLTSAISISIVLFLLGCIIFVGFMSKTLSTYVLESVSLTVFLQKNTTEESRVNLEKYLASQPYAKKVKFIDKATAIEYYSKLTGIDSVQTDGEDDEWFDLNGQRLSGRPTQQGVYICNGRKVVIP